MFNKKLYKVEYEVMARHTLIVKASCAQKALLKVQRKLHWAWGHSASIISIEEISF